MLVLYFCHINQKMQTSFSNSREAAWFLLRIRKPNKNIFSRKSQMNRMKMNHGSILLRTKLPRWTSPCCHHLVSPISTSFLHSESMLPSSGEQLAARISEPSRVATRSQLVTHSSTIHLIFVYLFSCSIYYVHGTMCCIVP